MTHILNIHVPDDRGFKILEANTGRAATFCRTDCAPCHMTSLSRFKGLKPYKSALSTHNEMKLDIKNRKIPGNP